MKIKKSRPASQSTKVKRRKTTKQIFFLSTLAGYEVAFLLQSLINTNYSPLYSIPAPLSLHRRGGEKKIEGKPLHHSFPLPLQPELLFQSLDRTYTYSLGTGYHLHRITLAE